MEVAWAEFSTLSKAVLMSGTPLELKIRPRFIVVLIGDFREHHDI